jgi:hypothetical protein
MLFLKQYYRMTFHHRSEQYSRKCKLKFLCYEQWLYTGSKFWRHVKINSEYYIFFTKKKQKNLTVLPYTYYSILYLWYYLHVRHIRKCINVYDYYTIYMCIWPIKYFFFGTTLSWQLLKLVNDFCFKKINK